MSRRTIIIIGVILSIAIVAGILVYFFVLRQPEVPQEAQLTPEERARLTLTLEDIDRGITLEQKAQQLEEERRLALEQGVEIEPVVVEVADVKPIILKEVVSSTLAPDRKSLIYFDKEEEDFAIADLDGNNPRLVTSLDFKNVYEIDWSQNRDSAIIATSDNDGKDKQYTYVNLRDQSTFTYDDKFQGVTLNPEGDKITYLYYDEENDVSNISVANIDTSGFNSLYSYPDKNVDLNWLDDNYIQFNPQTTGFNEGEIAITDIQGDTYRVIVGEKFAVDTLSSPDNSMLVYTASLSKNPRRLKLFITDNQGMNEGDYLGLDTLVDKCAWSFDNKFLYCAVPDFYTDNLVMPNDYYNFKFITTDSFYKIDTETKRAKIIKASKDLDETYDAFQPYLSSDGKVLYFTNRFDGQLKGLTIPE